jgi:hypothetical protein
LNKVKEKKKKKQPSNTKRIKKVLAEKEHLAEVIIFNKQLVKDQTKESFLCIAHLCQLYCKGG